VDFGGKKEWVGTYDTPAAWGRARDALLAQLAAGARQTGSPLQGMTIAEFVGPRGERWPWDFNQRGRRRERSTFEHHEQCIRPLVAQFGDRLLASGINRMEAMSWGGRATENQLTSAIAMFNDARFIDESIANPFGGMSRERTRGRADLPDVLTVEEVERLKALALRLHPDGYGPVLEAMIEVMATSAPRTGELWAMERSRLDAVNNEVFVKFAVKKGGRLGPPKYEQERPVVLTPTAVALMLAMPVLEPKFLFPTRTGQLMSQSNWTTYWHPLRETFTATLPASHWLVQRIADQATLRAAEPDRTRRSRIPDGRLAFYELRHRGCTFMATPRPHGLGLAAPDIAYQVGHRDGGALVERLYIHRKPEHARDRIRAAMCDFDNGTPGL
jgi:integrase